MVKMKSQVIKNYQFLLYQLTANIKGHIYSFTYFLKLFIRMKYVIIFNLLV